MESLGQRIRNARKAKGMTQEQLASALYVSRQTVSSWENDRSEPSYEMLANLMELLDIRNKEEQSIGITDTHIREIKEYLSTMFAKWWVPDAVVFVHEIPRTSAGKFLKSKLRDQFKDYLCTVASNAE